MKGYICEHTITWWSDAIGVCMGDYAQVGLYRFCHNNNMKNSVNFKHN